MPGRFLVLVFLTIALTSCKFSKPILAIPVGSHTREDSLTHTVEKSKHFVYLNLRTRVSIGGVTKAKTYQAGELIEKSIYKRVNAWIADGDNRYYLKETTFDTTLNQRQVRYTIRQNRGRGSRLLYEKTLYLK